MPTQDGTETKQDVTTSAAVAQGTSKTTYTEEQVAERERKAKGDALADLGRLKSEYDKSTRIAQEAMQRLNKMEQDRINAELEAHKDDPAELRRIRAEQKASQLEADLAKERESRTEFETKLKTYETEQAEQRKLTVAQTVAKSLGVDADKLTSLAKFTDGSQAAIEAIAKELPKANTKPGFKPDSNRTIGGMMSWEQVRAEINEHGLAGVSPDIRRMYQEMKNQR